MSMTWHDLLFAHWPVAVEKLRKLIPGSLQVDTFDGEAWIGLVPFGMSHVRHRWLPAIPGTSRFPELNVRTYVTVDDKPGVWFFSLDAANRLAVFAARRLFHLPYLNARMSLECDREDRVTYHSERTHRGAVGAELHGSYRPTSPAYSTKEGQLDHWLTARYCLYSADRRGRLYRGEIDHPSWPLQEAEAEFREESMIEPLGITRADRPPLLHFVKRLDVVAWTLEPVAG
jgi:uncharacterized protein YqjF (DUF2071 family)